MFKRIISNRGVAAERHADGASTSGDTQPTGRRRSERQSHSLQLMLADLRIGDEPDHRLLNVPMVHRSRIDPLAPPVDQASVGLQGRAYLRFLATDRRMGSNFKMFIDGDRVLEDPHLTDAKANTLAEQLRPIVAQAYQDPQLIRTMDACALETTSYCSGRAQLFVGQMRDAALLSFVRTGHMEDVALYNLGVSFFMLDAVRGEVASRLPVGGDAQSVHAYLDAEFLLQDELNLPTNHSRPEHVNVSILNAAVAREIGNAVKAKVTQKNGGNVRDFLSTWAPWQEYILRRPENQAAYETMSQNFEIRLEKLEEARETPGSPESACSEADYLLDVEAIAAARADWIVQTTGQKTFEFWATHRAELLIDGGSMPQYFNRFRQ